MEGENASDSRERAGWRAWHYVLSRAVPLSLTVPSRENVRRGGRHPNFGGVLVQTSLAGIKQIQQKSARQIVEERKVVADLTVPRITN